MVNEQISTGTQNRSNRRSRRRRKDGRPMLYLFLALVFVLALTLIRLSVGREKEVEIVSSVMPGAGIQAIWNFAHVDLNVPAGVQVENVHLSDSLMKLSYNISRYRQENSEDK